MTNLNHEIKIAAVDLDETLLGVDGRVSAFTQVTLQRWLASGRRLIIATGRPTRMVGEALPDFLHDVPWISYNGAVIHEQRKLIFSDFLAPALGKIIVEQLCRELPDCGIGLEIDGELHLNRPSDKARRYQVTDPATLWHKSAAKILCFGSEPGLMRATFDSLPTGARVILSDKVHFAQIMSASADKAHALAHLVALWGVSLEQVISFGDDVNDTDMVRRCGIGVAMGNAAETVKAVAKRVAPNHAEDGVACVLSEFL